MMSGTLFLSVMGDGTDKTNGTDGSYGSDIMNGNETAVSYLFF